DIAAAIRVEQDCPTAAARPGGHGAGGDDDAERAAGGGIDRPQAGPERRGGPGDTTAIPATPPVIPAAEIRSAAPAVGPDKHRDRRAAETAGQFDRRRIGTVTLHDRDQQREAVRAAEDEIADRHADG